MCTCVHMYVHASMCSDELALLKTHTYIRLLIGLTSVCIAWYEHLFLRLRAPIGVCRVCVRGRKHVCCGMPLTAQCGCYKQ